MRKIINTDYFTNFSKKEEGKKLRVLFFQANTFASGYYRIGFIAEELAKRGIIEVDFSAEFHEQKDIIWRIGKADIVVFQLQTNDLISNVIDICNKNGILTVMDMDDDLLDVPDWNPAFFKLGRKRNFVWEKIYGKTDLKANINRIMNIKDMLRKVDLVTVTGKGLRNAYSKFNKVKMLPNLVDPEKIYKSKRSGGFFDKNTIRIFWQGSATHAKDLEEIKSVVPVITAKYPNVKWFIWGSGYSKFAESTGIPKNRVETKETVPMEKYYDQLKNIKMDIGICPLANIDYNVCKSNIKWLEYGLCGIPAVVSDISTYTDSVKHGRTGFVAKNTNDWIKYLSDLIENKELREIIAYNAKTQILQEFNLHNKIKMWEDTFLKLYEKKNARER